VTHLSSKEIEYFKTKLIEIREQLQRSLRGVTDDVTSPEEGSGYSQHQADQGTDDFDRTISIEVGSKELAILKQIDRALRKIEDNTYGYCDITENPIPKPRLEAVPWATMTVEAQEKLEKGLL
jgi:DnaK suppressor protein